MVTGAPRDASVSPGVVPAGDGDPGLVWSIKASFVEYIERMSDGVVTLSDGATRRPDGAFHFPLDRTSSTDRDVAFRGSVLFTGHFGMLVVAFTRPAIVRREGRLHLCVREDEVTDGHLDVLVLGDARSSAGGLVFSQPQLTSNGADIFFDKYRPGTAFDPVLVLGSPLDAGAVPS